MNVATRGIRNAFRNVTRTVSIIVILGLSIGLSLTMLIAHRAVDQKITSVKSSIGNTITLSPAGFRDMQGGGDPLTSDQLGAVAKIDHVTNVQQSMSDRLTTETTSLTSAIDLGSLGERFGPSNVPGPPQIMIMGNDGNPIKSTTPPITVLGTTDPTKVDSSTIHLTSGAFINGKADANKALVGKTLAEKNNLSVGSTFTAYGTTVTVAGIFDAGTTFRNNQVILSLSTLQQLSGQAGEVTSATVTVDSISNMDSVTSAIKNKLGSKADITSSKETAENAVAPLESIKKVSVFSLIGAVVAGSIIILLTMIMVVRERQREIGVLKAIGGSNIRIMGQFMSESLTLAVLGAVIGLALGVVGANPVTKMLVNNSTSSTTSQQHEGFGAAVGRSNMMHSETVDSGASSGSASASASGSSSAGPQMHGFGERFRQNSTIRGINNISATVGWSIIVYGLVAAMLIALIGSALASIMIAKIRPSQVMRTE